MANLPPIGSENRLSIHDDQVELSVLVEILLGETLLKLVTGLRHQVTLAASLELLGATFRPSPLRSNSWELLFAPRRVARTPDLGKAKVASCGEG